MKNERRNGPRKFLLSSLRVFALKKIPRKRARKTTKAKAETTTTKRSAMLMTRAKRMNRKKLLTRKKTKRKR